MIRDAGRIPAERHTTYKIRKIFDSSDVENDPLDYVGDNVEDIFGSYNKLINLEEYRFEHPNRVSK